jgi:hypothetical protein
MKLGGVPLEPAPLPETATLIDEPLAPLADIEPDSALLEPEFAPELPGAAEPAPEPLPLLPLFEAPETEPAPLLPLFPEPEVPDPEPLDEPPELELEPLDAPPLDAPPGVVLSPVHRRHNTDDERRKRSSFLPRARNTAATSAGPFRPSRRIEMTTD